MCVSSCVSSCVSCSGDGVLPALRPGDRTQPPVLDQHQRSGVGLHQRRGPGHGGKLPGTYSRFKVVIVICTKATGQVQQVPGPSNNATYLRQTKKRDMVQVRCRNRTNVYMLELDQTECKMSSRSYPDVFVASILLRIVVLFSRWITPSLCTMWVQGWRSRRGCCSCACSVCSPTGWH